MPRLLLPLAGIALAIAVTTTMDITGLGIFSALPLWPLAGLFWYLQKFSRREVGLVMGGGREYLWAVAYPLAVPGLLAVVALATGQTDLTEFDGGKTALNLLLVGVTTTIMTVLTEEGFFRGWLWAALERALGPGRAVWLVSSVGFMLWHVSAVVFMEELRLPAAQMPIYLGNVLLIGLAWGKMRERSGSLVVPAVSHGVWNALVYILFGPGTGTGALGIADTATWGPETGWLGLLVNAAFVVIFSRLGGPHRRLRRA